MKPGDLSFPAPTAAELEAAAAAGEANAKARRAALTPGQRLLEDEQRAVKEEENLKKGRAKAKERQDDCVEDVIDKEIEIMTGDNIGVADGDVIEVFGENSVGLLQNVYRAGIAFFGSKEQQEALIDADVEAAVLRPLARKNARVIANKDCGVVTTKPKPRRRKRKSVLKELKKRQIEQAYLLQNLEAIATDAISPDPQTLENLIQVEAGGELMNDLTTSRLLSPLFSALPADLSSLTPYVKMYRRDRDENGNYIDRVFRFANSMPDVVDLFRETKGLGHGVGLKSFRWETTGKNPYSAPRTLIASMKIHFQSISELYGSAEGGNELGELRWAELLMPPGPTTTLMGNLCWADVQKKYPNQFDNEEEYKDRVKLESGKKQKGASSTTLMVETGWAYTKKNILSEEMKMAVDKAKMVFSLRLNRHNFNFNQDGTIDLDIDFNSSMETRAGAPESDVLTLGLDGKSAIQKEIKNLETKIGTENTSVANLACDIAAEKAAGSGKKKSKNEIDKKAKEKCLTEYKKALAAAKKERRISNYGRFVQNLLKKERLFRIVVSEEQYEAGQLPLRKPQPASNRNAADKLAEGTVAAEKKRGKKKRKSKRGKKNSEQAEIKSGTLLSRLRAEFKADKSLKRGQKAVYFFYLGDLLDYYTDAMSNSARNMKKDESANKETPFRMILGEFNVYNYKAIVRDKINIYDADDEELLNKEKYATRTNLANLPISLDLYSMWFTDKMVNKADEFSFKRFIDLLMPEVTSNALSVFVDSDPNLNEKIRISEKGLPIKTSIAYGANSLLEERSQNHYPIEARDLSNLVGGESPILLERDLIGNQNGGADYMILYSKRLPAGFTEVNEAENAKSGIYHFRLGSDRGIVKSIELQKTDNKAIQARNIMHAYNRKDGYGLLQEPYDGNITIFGGAMFQPGQYIYINPTGAGLGTGLERLSIAHRLGLGGFYLITKVTTDLEAGMLETKLECKFEHYGKLLGEKFVGIDADNNKTRTAVKLTGISGGGQRAPNKIEDPSRGATG